MKVFKNLKDNEVVLKFNAEIYTAIDNLGNHLKVSGNLDKMYYWAKRFGYSIVDVKGI